MFTRSARMINLSSLLEKGVSPAETTAQKNKNRMMTAGNNPSPVSPPQGKGGAMCPMCGHRHRPGSICSHTAKSVVDIWSALRITKAYPSDFMKQEGFSPTVKKDESGKIIPDKKTSAPSTKPKKGGGIPGGKRGHNPYHRGKGDGGGQFTEPENAGSVTVGVGQGSVPVDSKAGKAATANIRASQAVEADNRKMREQQATTPKKKPRSQMTRKEKAEARERKKAGQAKRFEDAGLEVPSQYRPAEVVDKPAGVSRRKRAQESAEGAARAKPKGEGKGKAKAKPKEAAAPSKTQEATAKLKEAKEGASAEMGPVARLAQASRQPPAGPEDVTVVGPGDATAAGKPAASERGATADVGAAGRGGAGDVTAAGKKPSMPSSEEATAAGVPPVGKDKTREAIDALEAAAEQRGKEAGGPKAGDVVESDTPDAAVSKLQQQHGALKEQAMKEFGLSEEQATQHADRVVDMLGRRERGEPQKEGGYAEYLKQMQGAPGMQPQPPKPETPGAPPATPETPGAPPAAPETPGAPPAAPSGPGAQGTGAGIPATRRPAAGPRGGFAGTGFSQMYGAGASIGSALATPGAAAAPVAGLAAQQVHHLLNPQIRREAAPSMAGSGSRAGVSGVPNAASRGGGPGGVAGPVSPQQRDVASSQRKLAGWRANNP